LGDSDSFQPGDYHAKNKLEKIILSAPKTAATLIIAATLNITPTINILVKNMFKYVKKNFFGAENNFLN
jgi:hypothetical protein